MLNHQRERHSMIQEYGNNIQVETLWDLGQDIV